MMTVVVWMISDVTIIEIENHYLVRNLNRIEIAFFGSYSGDFVKAELLSNSKALQRLALLLNEVETQFISSGLNFVIRNITSPITPLTAGQLYV